MTDATGRAIPHIDAETLSAFVDGELPAAAERETSLHLASCPECADRLAAFREVQQAVARPVAQLAEPAMSSLVASALAAAVGGSSDDGGSPPRPLAPSRSRSHTAWWTRAAVIVVVGAIAGGVVLATRASTRSNTSGSAAGANTGSNGEAGTTTIPGGGPGSVGAGGHGASHGAPAAALPASPSSLRGPAVLVFRPVLDLRHRTCPAARSTAPDRQLSVPVPLSRAGTSPACLQLGAAIVEAWSPTRVSVGRAPATAAGGPSDYYVTVALTPAAARVLGYHGVAGTDRLGPDAASAAPAVDAWRVVALEGGSVIADVSEVVTNGALRPTTSEAVLVGLGAASATQVRRALGG